MNDIRRKLEAYPREEFLSGSHAEALQWLSDLDLTDMLRPDWIGRRFVGASDRHKTHWIVVAVEVGNPEPGVDGMYISCLPRSEISGDALKALLTVRFGGGKVLVHRDAE
jgi:hypothetical protein